MPCGLVPQLAGGAACYTARMADPAKELIRLAMERFGNLWPAEAKMLRAAAEGRSVDLSASADDEDLGTASASGGWYSSDERRFIRIGPSTERILGPGSTWGEWEQWGSHRTIRSALFRWLCVEATATSMVHRSGLWVRHGHFLGKLDLAGAHVPFGMRLHACAIPEGVILREANIGVVGLFGCFVFSVDARDVRCRGGFLLRRLARVDSMLNVSNARIEGDLDLRASEFGVRGVRTAIDAESIVVEGSVRLGYRCRLHGAVNLRGAKIGSDVRCDGASFTMLEEYRSEPAFVLDGAIVEGNVALGGSFNANAPMSLRDASIRGGLELCGRQYGSTSCGVAINGSGVRVGRHVVIGRVREEESASGESSTDVFGALDLCGAQIGGDLSCDETSIHHKGDCSVLLSDSRVDGSVRFSRLAANGEMQARGARVAGSFEIIGSIDGDGDIALDARDLRVDGGLHLVLWARGTVSIRSVRIGRYARIAGTLRENIRIALDATDMVVAGTLQLGHGLDAAGLIDVASARLAELELNGMRVDGSVSLRSAAIERRLALSVDTTIRGVLDLSGADIASLDDRPDAWERVNEVRLLGCHVRSLSSEAPCDAALRIRLIERGLAGGFSPQPYRDMAHVLAQMGHGDESVKVRQAQYTARRTYDKPRSFWDLGSGVKYWWRWLVIRLLGCGYNRLGPLYAMFVLWLIGGLVFQAANRQGLMVPASDQVLTTSEYQQESGHKVPIDYQPMNVWTYSADAMLPFIDLHQERFWLPKRDPDPVRWRAIANLDRGTVFGYPFPDAGRFVRWYLWFHIAAGWVLSTLFVVGLSGIVKNEDGKSRDE